MRRPHHHTVAGRLVECWRQPCRLLATLAQYLPPSEGDD